MQQDMKYIYMVYKYGSFSKAAQALYITQPALSISVQKVEAEIGMPLFIRDRKPLGLTEAGKVYIEKIRQFQFLEDELSQQLNDLSQLKTGRLRVGGSHYFNSYILPPVLADYKKKWPGIQLELTEASSFELISMLKENEIDLTFNCTPQPRDNLRRIPGFEDRILLAVPKSYPVCQKLSAYSMTAADIMQKKHQSPSAPAVTLEEFGAAPFILLTPGNNLYSRCLAMFEESSVMPEVCMQVSQLVTAYHLSCAGIGATFISDWMVVCDQPEMLYFKVNSPQAVRVFDIVTSGKNYLSNAQKAFILMFKDHYIS